MSFISTFIEEKNKNKEKILNIFLTSGFPNKNDYAELALASLDAGADMLEIGFPFSDPLADGPIIQYSSQVALENGINLSTTFNYLQQIRSKTEKPLLLMGYANPVLSYGIENFVNDAKETGANGVIIPDIPIEEYDNFFNNSFDGLDTILLVTPTTSNERIKIIDEKSSGFVYCVSISGTTGSNLDHKKQSLEFIKRTSSTVKKNKTLVGFGISTANDAKSFSQDCAGVIVGSAVIKSLMEDDKSYSKTLNKIKILKTALKS
jgi:tryptophan synthase alpha chain